MMIWNFEKPVSVDMLEHSQLGDEIEVNVYNVYIFFIHFNFLTAFRILLKIPVYHITHSPSTRNRQNR